MQKIDNIEIKNFKSIRHQKIEGCKRVNVFIGYPNVGKSNILEAIGAFSFIQGGAKLNLNSIFRFERFPELFFDGNTDDSIEIILNGQQIVRIKIDAIDKLDISCSEIDLENNTEQEIYRGSIEGLVNYSTGETQSLIREIYWFLVKKYDFDKSSKGTEASFTNSLSFPAGQNLFDILSSNKQLKSEISGLFKDYNLSLAFDQATKELKILKKISEENIFLLPYNQIAETLKRLIFYKTAILSNKGTILLFEEPEAHMFPPYISNFTTDVMYDDSNQFFIATHSPFVINDFMENLDKDDYAIFAVGYNKENGETIIRKINDEEINEIYQYGIDLFFNLENYLKDVV